MLLAARAFISRKKRRTRSACRAVSIPMPCCRSATQWDGLGRFAVLRWPMSSTKIDGATPTGICSEACLPQALESDADA